MKNNNIMIFRWKGSQKMRRGWYKSIKLIILFEDGRIGKNQYGVTLLISGQKMMNLKEFIRDKKNSFINSNIFKQILMKFIFYIALLQTEMATQLLLHQMEIALERLEPEYPGISRIHFQCSLEFVHKLQKLTTKIGYSLPKLFYSDQIEQFETQLEDAYNTFLRHDFRPTQDINLPWEFIRKTRSLSDEEEALAPLSKINTTSKRYDLETIRSFISNFNLEESDENISRGLIDKNMMLKKCKKEEAIIEVASLQGKKDYCKMDRKGVIQKNTYFQKKNTVKNEGNKIEKTKIGTILTLGDKVPIEVREMRNQVKKLSSSNFGLQSQLNQQKLSLIEQQKMNIGYVVNKIAPDNQQQFFDEMSELVRTSHIFTEVFIDKMIQRCEIDIKEVQFYVNFLCKFMRISESSFYWKSHIDSKNGRNFNSFQRFIVEKLEKKFAQAINDPQPIVIISLASIFGKMIKNRKLSKKIYHYVNEQILKKIYQETKKDSSQKSIEIIETCFKALIALITCLGDSFDKIWEGETVSGKIHSEQLRQIIKSHQCQTIFSLLFCLNKSAKLPTSLIQCNLKNMIDRKNHQNKIQNVKEIHQMHHTQLKLKDQFVQAMKSGNYTEIKKLGEKKEKKKQIFEIVLEVVYDGSRNDVEKWLKLVMENIEDQDGDEFKGAWQAVWRDLIFQQCDYSFMVSSIAVLATHYMGRYRENCLIEVEEEDPDYEDCIFFMDKLEKRIQQCMVEDSFPIMP